MKFKIKKLIENFKWFVIEKIAYKCMIFAKSSHQKHQILFSILSSFHYYKVSTNINNKLLCYHTLTFNITKPLYF